MNYKSPIEAIYSDVQLQFEDNVYKAVQAVDIHVDREELIKALQYDRQQYEKGWRDALLKAQEPRVITADEMTELGKTGGAVWVEESPEGSDPKCFWGLVTAGVEPPKDKGYYYPGGVYFNVVDEEQDMWDGDFYGLKTPLGWRAWTAKPTDEQREETPW